MIIEKFLSITGYCSRRQAKRFIKERRVTINGVTANQQSAVEQGDVVLLDSQPIPRKIRSIYLAFNKPVGITCTAEEAVESNIISFVNYPERIFPVGRLDKASEGLIILTNDGSIVNKLLKSENNKEKEYIVTVDKPITDSFLQEMESGIEILNTKTKPCKVKRINDFTFNIILTQGLNRQIRRMCKALGYYVEKLKRVRIVNIDLGDLEVGEWRELTEEELKKLITELENK